MLYIGIDLGTSSVKLLLMDSSGKIVNIVTEEYPVSYPHPGWSEQRPEDFDGKIKAAQDKITALKKLIADVAIYVSERAKLTFSALKMNRVEISLYDVVKSTGERKDVFKFTYGGRRYDRLSLSEKIRAGMEVSELMKRLTGRNYPVFVDNMESVDDLNNVRPTGQVIMAKCVSGAPLAVRPVRPIDVAQRQAA